MAIRYLDNPSTTSTPKPNKPAIRYLEPEISLTKRIGKELFTTAGNIIPDISRTANIIPNVIGQTIANVNVDPKYALKTAATDIVGGVKGIAEMGKQGLKTAYDVSFLNPNPLDRVQKTGEALTSMGKYIQENPASTAFDILTLSPKSNIIKGTIDRIEELSKRITRRGLGFSKEMIRPIGAKETANKVAGELLKKDLIPASGSTEKTYQNILKLKRDTGDALSEIRTALNDSGNKSFSPIDLDDKVMAKLQKQYTTATDRNALNEIRKLILSQGEGGTLSFADATDLVQTLQSKSGFKKGLSVSDTTKAEMYRDAASIARELNDNAALEAAKKMGNSNLYQDYMTIKDVYRKADIAFDGIEDLRALQATDKKIGVINNPITKDILNRAFLGGGKRLFQTSKIAKAIPVKTLYYSGRAGQLGMNKGGK